jgi:ATP-dependent Clp protease ATP-binding subunit ClpC
VSYFDKFNQAARDVLVRAEFEAIQRDQAQFGPEHLLAAMHHGGAGIAGRALRTLGLREDRLLLALDHGVDATRPEMPGGAALSDRLKRVLAATVEEWRALGHPEIGPAHMLLGLCRDEEQHRSGVLASIGLEPEQVRAEVIRLFEARGPERGVIRRFVSRLKER